MIRPIRFALYQAGPKLFLLLCWRSHELPLLLWDDSPAWTGAGKWQL